VATIVCALTEGKSLVRNFLTGIFGYVCDKEKKKRKKKKKNNMERIFSLMYGNVSTEKC
jgi:hypothetical protein